MSLYPLNIEIELIQEDFIEVELIENIVDAYDSRGESVRVYAVQTIVMAVISAAIFFTSWVARESLYFTLAFWIFFTINFVYKYFIGHKNELKLVMQHLVVSNQKGNEFFTQEVGFASFFEKSIEFLTNEQRRYFDYSLIRHIKITRRLVIFVMKPSKEKGLKGFLYMIIPKRDLDDEQKTRLLEMCQEIKAKYSITDWVKKTIFD